MVRTGPWNLSIGTSLGVRNFLVRFLGETILSKSFLGFLWVGEWTFLGNIVDRCFFLGGWDRERGPVLIA